MKSFALSLCIVFFSGVGAVAEGKPTLEGIYTLCINALIDPDQAQKDAKALAHEFELFDKPGYWKSIIDADVGKLAVNAQPGHCYVEGWTRNGDFWEINVEWKDVLDRSVAFFDDPARGRQVGVMRLDDAFAMVFCAPGMEPYRLAAQPRSNRGPLPPLAFHAHIPPGENPC